MDNVNLYTKLMKMRVELQNKGIKKTGGNKFSKFMYYELDDFLPQCNQIANDNNAVFIYQLEKERAVLTLVNCEMSDEKISFSLPLAELSIAGANGIQNIGGLATYTRRYLYLIAFEISESDDFDPNLNPVSDNKDQADQQKQIEEISNTKINKAKIHTIQKELLRTGVTADAICSRYKVNELSDITEGIFPVVMKALSKTPDLVKGE